MKELEVEGKNIEHAIQKGLAQLGLSREQVEVKVLDEGKTGLFGLMGASPAKVKLIAADDAIRIVDYARVADDVRTKVETLISHLDINVTVDVSVQEHCIHVTISGPDTSLVIGRSGQTLDALEMLVNLMISRDQKARIRVTIDAEEYRKRKQDRLTALARSLASEVTKSGKAKEMRHLSSEERRMVHLALDNSVDVDAISKGNGSARRIVIIPKKSKTSFR